MDNTEDRTVELHAGFSGIARALFAERSVHDTLARTVDLAVEALDGCDLAGVFVIEDDAVTSPAHSDPAVLDIDSLQQQAAEGPCLEAIARGGAFYADDPRWPAFGPRAAAAGVRSVLSFRLYGEQTLGALNCYGRYPRAFGALDRAKGLLLATLAGLALDQAQVREAEERRAEHLTRAVASRELIGQAQGILMERERVSADQAFDILRRASQHLNLKLADVARDLVATGESPSTEPRRER